MRKFDIKEHTITYSTVVVPLKLPADSETWIEDMNDIDRETLLEAIVFRLVKVNGLDPDVELLPMYSIVENAMNGRIKDLEGFEFIVEGEE